MASGPQGYRTLSLWRRTANPTNQDLPRNAPNLLATKRNPARTRFSSMQRRFSSLPSPKARCSVSVRPEPLASMRARGEGRRSQAFKNSQKNTPNHRARTSFPLSSTCSSVCIRQMYIPFGRSLKSRRIFPFCSAFSSNEATIRPSIAKI